MSVVRRQILKNKQARVPTKSHASGLYGYSLQTRMYGKLLQEKKYVELLYRHRLPERGEFSTPTRSTAHPCGSGEQTVDTHCSHKRARMYTRHAHAAPAPSALKKKKSWNLGP